MKVKKISQIFSHKNCSSSMFCIVFNASLGEGNNALSVGVKVSVYVFYYNESSARVFTKSSVNDEAKELLRRNGYKKHFFEVEAESAKDAIAKMKNNDDEYLKELRDYSDSLLFVGLAGVASFF